MTRYLLDSYVAIELLRSRNLQLAERLASANRQAVFLSTVTIAELFFGAWRSRDIERNLIVCRRFSASLPILSLDSAAAERSAELRFRPGAAGQQIGAYDLLIAGIALTQQCVLVTHNTREFARIGELRVEDWTTATPS